MPNETAPNHVVLMHTDAAQLTVTLNRPDVCNALNPELIRALIHALNHAASTPSIHCVILRGNGRHFCSGADLNWLKSLKHLTDEHAHREIQLIEKLFVSLSTLPKPILTIAHGSTVGGGLGILACSDIVLAHEDAEFRFSEVTMGLSPAIIAPYILDRMPHTATRELMLTGLPFSARKALHLGLICHALRASKIEAQLQTYLERFSELNLAALAEVKHMLGTYLEPAHARCSCLGAETLLRLTKTL